MNPLQLDYPTIKVKIGDVTLRPPSGSISITLGDQPLFAHERFEYIYPFTFFFPEIIQKLGDCDDLEPRSSRSPQEWACALNDSEHRLSSQELLDGIAVVAFVFEEAAKIGWRKNENVNTAENWKVVDVEIKEMKYVADSILDYYEKLSGTNGTGIVPKLL